MIIPIVMYHGVTPWSEPRLFDALLDVPAGVRPAVEPYLVQFAYLLNDLSEISDDELRDGAMMTALAKLVTMCFKHARTRADFIKILGRWMDVVREVVQGAERTGRRWRRCCATFSRSTSTSSETR